MTFKTILILTLLISFSCKNETEEKAKAEVVVSQTSASPSPIHPKKTNTDLQALEGSYIGVYKDFTFTRGRLRGLLNFTVETIDEKEKTIAGYLLTEGKKTSFKSVYTLDEKVLTAKRKTTDKSPFLDSFEIKIQRDGAKLTLSRRFSETSELARKIFSYDPSLQIELKTRNASKNLNASTERLSEKNLKDESPVVLGYLKNSIYARHGLAFSDSRNIYFFENVVTWYSPYFLNVDDKLSNLEKENIALLEKLEKQAITEPAATSFPK